MQNTVGIKIRNPRERGTAHEFTGADHVFRSFGGYGTMLLIDHDKIEAAKTHQLRELGGRHINEAAHHHLTSAQFGLYLVGLHQRTSFCSCTGLVCLARRTIYYKI
jgi:hypothetical protein